MAANLTLEQRRQYARTFVELDTDGNGWLSREEVGEWLRRAGYNLTDQEKERVFRWMDGNADGRITLDEFLDAMEIINRPASQSEQTSSSSSDSSQRSHPTSSRPENLRTLFDSMDADGNGQLSEGELLRGLRHAGYDISQQSVRKLIAKLDRDGNGEVSFDEFITAFKV